MDNRWRFLYCGMTELWGHVQRAGAGNGKPGASECTREGGKSPSPMGRRDADRNEVGKPVSCASRKAAIVYTVPVP